MATLAVVVAATLFGAVDLSAMAAAARRFSQRREHEIVRRVARLASRSLVEGHFGSRGLVAAAARHDEARGVRRVRMRIVAAGAGRAEPTRVIAVHRAMTVRASGARRTLNVVRAMAARTSLMRGNVIGGERAHTSVAGATRLHLFGGKLVGLVATRALAMAVRKQRSHGDAGRVASEMAATAARLGRSGLRVRMAMARRANLNRIEILGLVCGVNLAVALRARERDRLRLLVNAMALGALGGLVRVNGRRVAERLRVATNALVRSRHGGARSRKLGSDGRVSARESVTLLAVAVCERAQRGARRRTAMLEARLFFMARRAALRTHTANATR